MAVLDALPGIEVTMDSQGRILPEYPDDSEWPHDGEFDVVAEKRSSVYVECESDASFKINFSMRLPYKLDCPMLTFWVKIDGQYVGGKSVSRHGVLSSMSNALLRAGGNEVSRRPFKFASIRRVDDVDSTRVMSDANVVSGIGEILIVAYRSREEEGHSYHSKQSVNSAPNEVAEKALKGQALSHGVAFGQEIREYRARIPKVIELDGRRQPIAVFSFKYRSRKALQQELIIPRSPSPDVVMGPLNSRSANVSHPESRELGRPKREMDVVKSEIKKEEGRKNQRGQKREGDEIVSSGRAYKTTRSQNGTVVVDLTDDD